MFVLRYAFLLLTAGMLVYACFSYPSQTRSHRFPELALLRNMWPYYFLTIPAAIAVFIGVEKEAGKINGAPLPLMRRLMIPVPAILFLVYLVLLRCDPYFYDGEGLLALILASVVLLPFLLMKKKIRFLLLLRFTLTVWAIYPMWMALFNVIMLWNDAPRWR